MKKKKLFIFMIFITLFLISCTEKKEIQYPLIAKFTSLPNEMYVDNEKDKVFYNIEIFQKDEKNIILKASSNSKFFKDIQKDIEIGKEIQKEDIKIQWKNLMGKDKIDKKNQIAIAIIEIKKSETEQVKLKINFVKNAIGMISEDILG